jgi:hypothetical protein
MMNKTYHLANLFGLELTAKGSAFLASAGLWIALALLGYYALDLPVVQAVLGGLIATLLHWLSELVHQLGHSFAARRVGYPMAGVRLHYILGASVYPRSEPKLPAKIHISRALGGPLFSAFLTAIAGTLVLTLRDVPGLPFYLAVFLMLENLFVFFLGAFLPLGFTDGSTLLYWAGKLK